MQPNTALPAGGIRAVLGDGERRLQADETITDAPSRCARQRSSNASGSVMAIVRSMREALGGELPPRYRESWRVAFDARVRPMLVPGVRILDVGAGRQPAIPVADRPPASWYEGLDLSRLELERAPAGSYDRLHVADVTEYLPELAGEFDLIVSFQVLEHVKPLDQALENLRAYLRPGGALVAQMSGSFSLFGLANRVVPRRLALWGMQRLLQRPPETVFPAYYHRCYYDALTRMLAPWSESQVVPRHLGAGYFGFARPLQATYIGYEEFVRTCGYRNLASYYLVSARR